MLSPIKGSPYISSSSESDESFELRPIKLSEDKFSKRFKEKEGVQTDEFDFSTTKAGKILDLTSCEIGDCITMFGISKDKKTLFAWHSSVIEDTEVDEVRKSLNEEMKQEGFFNSIGVDGFDIYLVGAKSESAASQALCAAMVDLVEKDFTNSNIAGVFLNPTKDPYYKCMTVNFNTNRELHYYFNN